MERRMALGYPEADAIDQRHDAAPRTSGEFKPALSLFAL